jgi:hypothetical protein
VEYMKDVGIYGGGRDVAIVHFLDLDKEGK